MATALHRYPVISLGGLPANKEGLYAHVNDRYLSNDLIAALASKVSIWKAAGLCSEAPLYDIIGLLTGYEYTTDAGSAGGYCDYREGIIAISKHEPAMRKLIVVCHEISHAIQADMGLFNDYGRILSWQVKMEQQCETMAYYLYHGLFPAMPVSYKAFNSYFKEADMIWLCDWYRGYVENDLVFKSKII